MGLEVIGCFAAVTGATGAGDEDDPVSLSKDDKGTTGWGGIGARARILSWARLRLGGSVYMIVSLDPYLGNVF